MTPRRLKSCASLTRTVGGAGRRVSPERVVRPSGAPLSPRTPAKNAGAKKARQRRPEGCPQLHSCGLNLRMHTPSIVGGIGLPVRGNNRPIRMRWSFEPRFRCSRTCDKQKCVQSISTQLRTRAKSGRVHQSRLIQELCMSWKPQEHW